jgi:zinc/manganese transport system ATP-binding protein
MLHAVDAQDFADRKVGGLSGGEQQRVLIAHALVSQPELLLLDEPLANLDPGSVQEIIGLLHRVATQQHVAIFLSAHEMNPLLPVMDRVVYVANGRVASGTTDEVVRPDVLSSLYGHHVDVIRVHGRVLVVAEQEVNESSAVANHPEFVVE